MSLSDTDITLSGGQTESDGTDSTDGTDGTDTNGTNGTNDTGGMESGEMCSDNVQQTNECEKCMAANCCDSYAACAADMACSCVVDNCTAPNAAPLTCALPCMLTPAKLMTALNYLTACSEPCGVQCPALGLP